MTDNKFHLWELLRTQRRERRLRAAIITVTVIVSAGLIWWICSALGVSF